MARNLAKEFGDFWKGGDYLFTQTPKDQTIKVKFRSGTVADFPARDLQVMKSDSEVLDIVSNKTGKILYARENRRNSSTGHLIDL